MQKDSLVAARNAQCPTHLVLGETLDVSQEDNLTLTRCQIVESRREQRGQSSRVETALTVVAPSVKRIGPLPLCIKPCGVNRME